MAAHKAKYPHYRFRPAPPNQSKHPPQRGRRRLDPTRDPTMSPSPSPSPSPTRRTPAAPTPPPPPPPPPPRRRLKDPPPPPDEHRCAAIAALLVRGVKGARLARRVRELDQARPSGADPNGVEGVVIPRFEAPVTPEVVEGARKDQQQRGHRRSSSAPVPEPGGEASEKMVKRTGTTTTRTTRRAASSSPSKGRVREGLGVFRIDTDVQQQRPREQHPQEQYPQEQHPDLLQHSAQTPFGRPCTPTRAVAIPIPGVDPNAFGAGSMYTSSSSTYSTPHSSPGNTSVFGSPASFGMPDTPTSTLDVYSRGMRSNYAEQDALDMFGQPLGGYTTTLDSVTSAFMSMEGDVYSDGVVPYTTEYDTLPEGGGMYVKPQLGYEDTETYVDDLEYDLEYEYKYTMYGLDDSAERDPHRGCPVYSETKLLQQNAQDFNPFKAPRTPNTHTDAFQDAQLLHQQQQQEQGHTEPSPLPLLPPFPSGRHIYTSPSSSSSTTNIDNMYYSFPIFHTLHAREDTHANLTPDTNPSPDMETETTPDVRTPPDMEMEMEMEMGGASASASAVYGMDYKAFESIYAGFGGMRDVDAHVNVLVEADIDMDMGGGDAQGYSNANSDGKVVGKVGSVCPNDAETHKNPFIDLSPLDSGLRPDPAVGMQAVAQVAVQVDTRKETQGTQAETQVDTCERFKEEGLDTTHNLQEEYTRVIPSVVSGLPVGAGVSSGCSSGSSSAGGVNITITTDHPPGNALFDHAGDEERDRFLGQQIVGGLGPCPVAY